MNIRAILLDMDGTLLGRSQVAVSVRNMEALARAMEKGVAVIPCTGRVFDMMPPQLLTMEGLRYYITSHGAAAYDRLEKKNIYEDTIPADEAARLMEMLEGRGLYNEIAARNTIWLAKRRSPIRWRRSRCRSITSGICAIDAIRRWKSRASISESTACAWRK